MKTRIGRTACSYGLLAVVFFLFTKIVVGEEQVSASTVTVAFTQSVTVGKAWLQIDFADGTLICLGR
ncbi:MAG: hypothetical protein NVS1B11_34660 [Terriglobales bacterium]